MARISPWVTGPQDAEISRLATYFVGLSVTSVEYLSTAALGVSENASVLHEVDQAVAMRLDDSAHLTISWAMDGCLEGLAFAPTHYPGEFRPGLVERFDVSTSHVWRSIVRQRVVAVAVATHSSNEACPDSIWSVRLEVSGGASVVIALGDASSGQPEYRPDGLVVMGDMAIASRYSTASGETALGRLVPLLT